MEPNYEGHTPLGVYDVLGSDDCPGPYEIRVTSVPRKLHNQIKPYESGWESRVRSLSVVTSYGNFGYHEVLEVLAIFTDRRISPYDGMPVDSCVRLPYALCSETDKAFDLIDAMVVQGFDEVERRVRKWLYGRLEKMRPLFNKRKSLRRQSLAGLFQFAINLSPRGDTAEVIDDEEEW